MRASSRALKSLISGAKDTAPTPYAWTAPSVAGPSKSSGKLAGRRIAIKENISYASAPTTCSSLVLEDHQPYRNSTCVDRLLSEGAEIAGMTKMDEFGMGSTTSHTPSHYTPVHNPFPGPGSHPRSAGGSSGGSAAAVASGSAWAALGTDTGGSVRLPAAYCGVVGLKPSYGMISRRGVVAYADSLDCVGVLARDVKSVAEVYGVVSEPDAGDMTCASISTRRRAKTILHFHIESHLPDLAFSPPTTSDFPLKGLRIGLPIQTHFPAPHLSLSPSLLENLQSLGATLVPVSLPNITKALPAYYVLASAEASSNLARYGGGWFGSSWESQSRRDDEVGQGDVRVTARETGEERRRRIRTEGFGAEVKKRILAGTYALSADEFNNTYLKALHLRSKLRQDFARVFRIPHPSRTLVNSINADTNSNLENAIEIDIKRGIDVLLHPTAIRTAPFLNPSTGDTDSPSESEGVSEYEQDILTVPASLAGLPAMSVPAGTGPDGWPVGVSLVGQWGCEDILFALGRVMEER